MESRSCDQAWCNHRGNRIGRSQCQASVPNGKGRWQVVVIGRGQGDRLIDVVFVVDPDKTVYVIDAMQVFRR